jgi:rubrerythrin
MKTGIKEKTMSKTQDNLKNAFAGESQASRKYAYFAEKADAEGLTQVARLFRAAAEAETVHARNHLNAASGIGSTRDNLKAAISGEHYEFNQKYPPFIEQAKADGDAKAERSFSHANKVEEIHHTLYSQALAALEKGIKLQEGAYYVCPVCGNTVFGAAPDICPICHAPGKTFKKIS